jgi:ATP sulfurylase
MGQHHNTIGYLGTNNYYTKYQGQYILTDQPGIEVYPIIGAIPKATTGG